MQRHLSIAVLLLAACGAGRAQSRLQLDLPALEAKASSVSDITLDGAALKFGAAFLDKEPDAEGRDVLGRLKRVYVKEYEFSAPGRYSDSDLGLVRAELQSGGWTRIVSVRGKYNGVDGESDEVYLLTAGDAVHGVAVLALKPREVSVIDIEGNITPDELTELGGHLGLPALEKGDGKRDGKHEEKN